MLNWEDAVQTLRNNPEAQELVKACYYDDPLMQAANRFVSSREWLAVDSLLPTSRGKALDLGAGRGISSFALAKQGWGVTSLEPDPSDIVGAGAIEKLAKESSLSIDVVQEWGEALPFEDGYFDLVYGRAVFHHANDLEQFCSEVFRVLKSGGSFLITREHVISKHSDLGVFLEAHPLHNLYGGEAAYLLEEYINAIEQANLKIQQVLGPHSTPINYFPTSEDSHLDRLAWRIGGKFTRFGRRLARQLVTFGVIRRYAESLLNSEDSYPGRLYSFLATKP
jgi:SAM-dependent methyltransferase